MEWLSSSLKGSLMDSAKTHESIPNTNPEDRVNADPGQTRGGIRCLRGVNIP
jgi:hypothetical protein